MSISLSTVFRSANTRLSAASVNLFIISIILSLLKSLSSTRTYISSSTANAAAKIPSSAVIPSAKVADSAAVLSCSRMCFSASAAEDASFAITISTFGCLLVASKLNLFKKFLNSNLLNRL